MERLTCGKEKLVVPTDFTSPLTAPINTLENLVPPSHFASSVQPTGVQRSARIPAIPPPISWINTGGASGDSSSANPWLAITQAQQEILELRKENQSLMKLHRDNLRGATSVGHLSDPRARSTERAEQWSRLESDLQLEVENLKAEAGRLKGQVEALKETAERYRDEIRDKDADLNRHSHEVETMRKELCKTKSELSQAREELSLSSAQKEEISSQLETLRVVSCEDVAKLRRDVETSKEASREMALKAEMWKLQAEEEAKQQMLRLSRQLEEMRKRQEVEVQQLSASHGAELDAARKTSSELQDRLQSITSEVLQLKSSLMEVSIERDGLKEHLSQMGHAFQTQSATLHSLRNYIGQLAPEKGEKERLNEAVEKLNKEKADLLTTTELLTVRFDSLHEILTLQEEKLMKEASIDPRVKDGCESLQVLQLWREKVHKLCIQLRFKDIELRREKGELLSKVKSMEQQLQQEQHQASVLQHSLQDRVAQVDLERMEKQALKEDLAKVRMENAELESRCKTAEAAIQSLTEAAQRFSQTFESQLAEVVAAQAKLFTFTQRLTFAHRRVETIQALVMRRAALQRVEEACKQTEEVDDRNFEREHSLVCEERDRLTRELKRTPELIERALADLKQQYESKVKQQQQELQRSSAALQQAAAGRDEAERRLLQIRAQLEQDRVDVERVRGELLHQQEHSEQALKERVCEIEERCAARLKEMEAQVDTARREHTKAVMTLRQFEREAVRRQEEIKEPPCLESDKTEREVLNKFLMETAREKTLLSAAAAPRRPIRDFTRPHTAAPLTSAAFRKHRHNPPERSFSQRAKVHQASDERLLCVLEELHTLSAAVVNSSEDSAEEEEEEEGRSDSVGPATGSLHS